MPRRGEPALGELTETVIAEAARDFFGLRRIAADRVRGPSRLTSPVSGGRSKS